MLGWWAHEMTRDGELEELFQATKRKGRLSSQADNGRPREAQAPRLIPWRWWLWVIWFCVVGHCSCFSFPAH